MKYVIRISYTVAAAVILGTADAVSNARRTDGEDGRGTKPVAQNDEYGLLVVMTILRVLYSNARIGNLCFEGE